MNDLLAKLPEMNGAVLTGMRIFAIVLGAWILSSVLTRLIRIFRERIASRITDNEAVKRADTLGRVFRYLTTVVVSLIAGMLILSELGISVTPILGAAGLLGIAVGFGAQSLVKDYFTGFFILLENQIRQGDSIEVAGKSGLVEEITLRFVRLRDYEGNVHFIPNGLITAVTNRSRGYAHAVIDIGIGYRADVDRALAIMREVADALIADPAFQPKILTPMEIAGVERFTDAAVVLRGRFKVAPLAQADVRREYMRRLKYAFDTAGIDIPHPPSSGQPSRDITARELAPPRNDAA